MKLVIQRESQISDGIPFSPAEEAQELGRLWDGLTVKGRWGSVGPGGGKELGNEKQDNGLKSHVLFETVYHLSSRLITVSK